MQKSLDEVGAKQSEATEKWKLKLQQYQNDIDMREMDLNRVKKLLE